MKSIKFLAVALVAMVAFAACSKEKSAELILDRTSLYFTAWGDPAQRVRYVARDADGGVAIASLSPGWNASMDYATQSILVWPEGATEEGVTNDDLPKAGHINYLCKNLKRCHPFPILPSNGKNSGTATTLRCGVQTS